MHGESLISESDNGELQLTTHRVRLEINRPRKTTLQSIFLENITSCSLVKKGDWVYLIAAVVVLPLAPIFLLAFIATYRHRLEIWSAKSRIQVVIRAIGVDGAKEFIDEIARARQVRISSLLRSPDPRVVEQVVAPLSP